MEIEGIPVVAQLIQMSPPRVPGAAKEGTVSAVPGATPHCPAPPGAAPGHGGPPPLPPPERGG